MSHRLLPARRRPTVTRGLVAFTATAVVVVGGVLGTRTAVASGQPIKPHQYFIGLVNGSTGRPNPAVIQMACFGAIMPGETGHPMPGQTIAVRRVPPSPKVGLTGANTNSIGAFFGVLPPSPVASSSSWVDFTTYGVQPLPTSLTLPCGGSSNVNFVPIPLEPSRLYAVPVTYAGQP